MSKNANNKNICQAHLHAMNLADCLSSPIFHSTQSGFHNDGGVYDDGDSDNAI